MKIWVSVVLAHFVGSQSFFVSGEGKMPSRLNSTQPLTHISLSFIFVCCQRCSLLPYKFFSYCHEICFHMYNDEENERRRRGRGRSREAHFENCVRSNVTGLFVVVVASLSPFSAILNFTRGRLLFGVRFQFATK